MYELVCRSCGGTDCEGRTRCDGCWVVLDHGLGSVGVPGVRNSVSLCDDCRAAVYNAVAPLLLQCARCGHARPDHNVGCVQSGCECPGWEDRK